MAHTVVVAPIDLPEGYVFEVEVDGKVVNVTVPQGGVVKGQSIHVPRPGTDTVVNDATEYLPMHKCHEAPTGRWTTGFCDFCDTCCSSLCCTACCCAPILYAQLLTRMNLTCCGNPGSPQEVSTTFAAVLTFFVLALLISFGTIVVPFAFWVGLGFFIYISMVSSRLRYTMRQRYQIPGTVCEGPCDDCLCTCPFCSCCTAVQMARHSNHPYECCSTNGLHMVV